MKAIFDSCAYETSQIITKRYSTSFYAGIQWLDRKIQYDIHAIYGLVRYADEIVDTFHDFDKEKLLSKFKKDTFEAIDTGISLNPVLQAFQLTVNKYNIDIKLIEQFFHSMEMDLSPRDYNQNNYDEYIYGSAEVVGLMCLKIFVYGNEDKYQELLPYAKKLGSAFQKINFLRDLKDDFNELGRVYFPNLDTSSITEEDKSKIEKEIQEEFDYAYEGIKKLPRSSRFGVYLSYTYYKSLLKKVKRKSVNDLLKERIRIPNGIKMLLMTKSYIRNSFNLL